MRHQRRKEKRTKAVRGHAGTETAPKVNLAFNSAKTRTCYVPIQALIGEDFKNASEWDGTLAEGKSTVRAET